MITTFVTVIFIIASIFMVLVILLQAGRGGGLGTALGGGASQTVFGGAGGADLMARLTQGFAATFMLCAMFLAYSAAHSGSSYLKGKSSETEAAKADPNLEVDYEAIGPGALRLPEKGSLPSQLAGAKSPDSENDAAPDSDSAAPMSEPVPEDG